MYVTVYRNILWQVKNVPLSHTVCQVCLFVLISAHKIHCDDHRLIIDWPRESCRQIDRKFRAFAGLVSWPLYVSISHIAMLVNYGVAMHRIEYCMSEKQTSLLRLFS